jgi:hypothetical protein
MKMQDCRIWRRLHWQVVVNASEVLACKHLQGCPHKAIRSDIHTVHHFLFRARYLTCNALNFTYRTKNRQFSGDVMCDLCKLRLM